MSKKKDLVDEGYPLSEYPEVEPGSVDFPKEVYIAFAVCSENCGAMEHIADGETQVCDYCGRLMFKYEIRKYFFSEE